MAQVSTAELKKLMVKPVLETYEDVEITEESCIGCEHETCCAISNLFEQFPSIKRVVFNNRGCFRTD